MRHGPSQQGRTPSQHPGGAAPTPQASTPFSNPQTQAAFSPYGPRSSPQQFKKSPAATKASPATTVAGIMGSHHHPHSTAAQQPVNFDSPSAAAALGALGINDLGLDALSMGGLVGPGSGEDDRKRRMDEVVKLLLDANTARVSNDSLERLAGQLNLDSIWEDAIGDKNAKTLIIAGSNMSVEVGLNDHIVTHAALAFIESIPIIDRHVERASEILRRDLSLAPGQSPLTKYLTEFTANLRRLATLDKLSVSPGLNCHEAIAGVYESLERLHTWDVQRLREDPALGGLSDDRLRVYALCTRHGYPQMHVRRQIGLSLDYWKEARKLPSTTVDTDVDDRRTWAIKISCAPMGGVDHPTAGMAHTPVRVSDRWIGPDIEKPAAGLTDEDIMSAAVGPVLDWLEPEGVLLPPSEEAKAADPMAGPRAPDVVFLATFNPPLIVTQAAAAEVCKLCATEPHMSGATFDVLSLPVPEGSAYDPSEPRMVEHVRTLATFPRRNEAATPPSSPELKTHRNTLHIYKPVYGQLLRELPFSHPRELVQMLPILRQYAFLSTLLFNSFKREAPSGGSAGSGPKPAARTQQGPLSGSAASTITDDFARFMAREATSTTGGPGADDMPSQDASAPKAEAGIPETAVDITLTMHPATRLQIVFPFRDRAANVHVEVQPGGRVHVVSHNIFEGVAGEPRAAMAAAAAAAIDGIAPPQRPLQLQPQPQYTVAQWAGLLETTEDIGHWIEFIKARLE